MSVDLQVSVAKLVQACPDVIDVLGWYGVQITEPEKDMTLPEVCEVHGIDLDDLLFDIEAILPSNTDDNPPAAPFEVH